MQCLQRQRGYDRGRRGGSAGARRAAAAEPVRVSSAGNGRCEEANGNKTTETVAFDFSKEMNEPGRYGELIHYPILSSVASPQRISLISAMGTKSRERLAAEARKNPRERAEGRV